MSKRDTDPIRVIHAERNKSYRVRNYPQNTYSGSNIVVIQNLLYTIVIGEAWLHVYRNPIIYSKFLSKVDYTSYILNRPSSITSFYDDGSVGLYNMVTRENIVLISNDRLNSEG